MSYAFHNANHQNTADQTEDRPKDRVFVSKKMDRVAWNQDVEDNGSSHD
jgi:hypothetical protein